MAWGPWEGRTFIVIIICIVIAIAIGVISNKKKK